MTGALALAGATAIPSAVLAGAPPVPVPRGRLDPALKVYLDGPDPKFLKLFSDYVAVMSDRGDEKPDAPRGDDDFISASRIDYDLRGNKRPTGHHVIDLLDSLLEKRDFKAAQIVADDAIKSDVLAKIPYAEQPRCAVTLMMAAGGREGEYAPLSKFYFSEFLRQYKPEGAVLQAVETAPGKAMGDILHSADFQARVAEQAALYVSEKRIPADDHLARLTILRKVTLFEVGKICAQVTGMPYVPSVALAVPPPWDRTFRGVYIDFRMNSSASQESKDLRAYVANHMGADRFYCLNDDGVYTPQSNYLDKLFITVHELAHSCHMHWVIEAAAGRMSEDDPRYTVARLVAMNMAVYTSPDDEACAENIPVSKRAAWRVSPPVLCERSVVLYNMQLTETMAHGLAAQTISTLMGLEKDQILPQFTALCNELRYPGFNVPSLGAGLVARRAPR